MISVGGALLCSVLIAPPVSGQSGVRTKVRKAVTVQTTHTSPFTSPSKRAMDRSVGLTSHHGPRGGGPVNDDCAGAISLTPGTPCSPITVDATGATQCLVGIAVGESFLDPNPVGWTLQSHPLGAQALVAARQVDVAFQYGPGG